MDQMATTTAELITPEDIAAAEDAMLDAEFDYCRIGGERVPLRDLRRGICTGCREQLHLRHQRIRREREADEALEARWAA
jgi:hypothetical protein